MRCSAAQLLMGVVLLLQGQKAGTSEAGLLPFELPSSEGLRASPDASLEAFLHDAASLHPTYVGHLPQDWDPVVLALQPGVPMELQHPCFQRESFSFLTSFAHKWLGPDLSGTMIPTSDAADNFQNFGLWQGRGLPQFDPLQRPGPLAQFGPVQSFKASLRQSSRLEAVKPNPLAHADEDMHELMLNPLKFDLTDPVKAFTMQLRGMNSREFEEEHKSQNPLRNLQDFVENPPIDPLNSHQARAMRSKIDDDIVHPEDRSLLPDYSQPAPVPVHQAQWEATSLIDEGIASGRYTERYSMSLPMEHEPTTMHMRKAEALAEADPRQDASLGPVLTGGICIGIKCSDGVVLAADTCLWTGSTLRYHDMRRLHKVSNEIVIAADGEYGDFQDIQTMFAELVQEHEDLEPVGTHKVLPRQAFNVLRRVMWSKRNQMDPFWNTVLIAGYGPPCGKHIPQYMEYDEAYSEPFLGMVDMHGTPLSQTGYYATGIGNYLALPLLRQATQEAEQWRQEKLPVEPTTEEATKIACDVMRVLSLRVTTCSNRIQLAKVDAEGVALTAPFRVTGEHNFDGFHFNEDGCSYQTPYQGEYPRNCQ